MVHASEGGTRRAERGARAVGGAPEVTDGDVATGDDDGSGGGRGGGRGEKRRMLDGGAAREAGEAQDAGEAEAEEMVGVVDAGEIYVRDGLCGSKAGKAVWTAGRRGRPLRLRDVRVAWSRRVINGEVAMLTAGDLKICKTLRAHYRPGRVGGYGSRRARR